MTEYDNTNRGTLFKNDRKEKDTHPDYKGSLNVGGVDYWLSAWLNESRDGKKYMSLSVQPKEQSDAPRERAAEPAASKVGEFDDDIPF